LIPARRDVVDETRSQVFPAAQRICTKLGTGPVSS
jgi:hypothetical protein